MEKITFVNNSEPYLSAETLSQLQTNIENAINEVTKKDIIVVNTNQTSIVLAASGKIPFSNVYSQLGDKLTLENNCIKIGAGVSYIKVSANIWINSNDTNGGRLWCNINKNNTTIVSYIDYVSTSSPYLSGCIAPILIPVNEGDLISIGYTVTGSVNLNSGSNNTNVTNLTVEVIE